MMTPGSECCNPCSLHKRRNRVEQHDAELARDIAKDMNSLTVSERARALDDVHGVSKIQEETPDFLQSSLKGLERELSKLTTRQKLSLTRAFFLRPLLEDDDDFKLMFLRAEEYNAKKAAVRMARHFRLKAQLFGQDKLAKAITLDDLSDKDMEVFRAGHLAVFPFKDQIGRPILFIDTGKADFRRVTSDNLTRAFWYMAMSTVSHDETAQKKGCVSLIYNSGKTLLATDTFSKATMHTIRSGSVLASIPFRYSSIHFCYDDAKLEFILKAVRITNTTNYRSRVITHFGSEMENEYKLMSFGIQALNTMQSAKLGLSMIAPPYLQERVRIDQALTQEEQKREDDTGMIEYPKPQDVLIGRGAPFRDFAGTLVWDKLILTHLQEYQESSTFEKTCLTMDMVKKIQESNGRFLERTNQGWKVLEDAIARKKAAVSFRSRVKAASLQQQNYVAGEHVGSRDDTDASTMASKRLRIS